MLLRDIRFVIVIIFSFITIGYSFFEASPVAAAACVGGGYSCCTSSVTVQTCTPSGCDPKVDRDCSCTYVQQCANTTSGACSEFGDGCAWLNTIYATCISDLTVNCYEDSGSVCPAGQVFCGDCIGGCRPNTQTCTQWIANECGGGGGGGGSNTGTCSGDCYSGVSNCGDVSKTPGSGTCANPGDICCNPANPNLKACDVRLNGDHNATINLSVGETQNYTVWSRGQTAYIPAWFANGTEPETTITPQRLDDLTDPNKNNFDITGVNPGSYTLEVLVQMGANAASICRGWFPVTVTAPPPTVELKANGIDDNLDVVYGGDVELSWSSTNASNCTVSGNWTGARPTSGNEGQSNIVTPKIYNISCQGVSGGFAFDTVVVTPSAPPPTVILRANGVTGSTTINAGDPVGLSWISTSATSCTASGAWSGAKPPNATGTIDSLPESAGFSITCQGPGGVASSQVLVNVVSAPSVFTPPTVTLTVDGDPEGVNVDSGDSVLLEWTSTNAGVCTATGTWTGAKPSGGSQTIPNVTTSRSFAITCSNQVGSDTDTVQVIVNGQTPPAPPTYPYISVITNPPNLEIDLGDNQVLTAVPTPINGTVNRVFFTPIDTTVSTITAYIDPLSPYQTTVNPVSRGTTYIRVQALMNQGPMATVYVPSESLAIEIGGGRVYLDEDGTSAWDGNRCQDTTGGSLTGTGAGSGTLISNSADSTVVDANGNYTNMVVPPLSAGTYTNTLQIADPLNFTCTCPKNCVLVTNPADVDDLTLDYYVTSARDPWFSVEGGDVHADNQDPLALAMVNPVPFTCEVNQTDGGDCLPYTIRRADQSLVGTSGVASIGIGDLDSWSASGLQQYSLTQDDTDVDSDGEPEARYSVSAFSPPYQTYDFLYRLMEFGLNPLKNDFAGGFDKPSVPPTDDKPAYVQPGDLSISSPWNVTINDGSDLDDDGNGDGVMVVFVEGNLQVSAPITVENGAYLAFIVHGNISFDPNLGDTTPSDATDDSSVAGMFIADGLITVDSFGGGTADYLFVGEGTFVGWSGVIISRDYQDNLNNTKPTAIFKYRPDLLLNTPESLRSAQYLWRQAAP